MSDFIESAKNFVGAAVSRTSWEAQKQLRVRNKQSEIDKLMEQRQQLTNDIVQIALNLYQQGILHDPQMSRLCASIVELDHDVRSRDEQLQEIKKEAYQNEQYAPGPTMNYSPPPVSPQPQQPQQPFYQQQPAAPPPPTGASQAGAAPQTQICPNCGHPLRPGALYCRTCGEKVG
jgi:hypothetical protein